MSEKLLIVSTPDFRAGALFRKVYGVWACHRASRRLKWMVGKSMLNIRTDLARMGGTCRWIATKTELNGARSITSTLTGRLVQVPRCVDPALSRRPVAELDYEERQAYRDRRAARLQPGKRQTDWKPQSTDRNSRKNRPSTARPLSFRS